MRIKSGILTMKKLKHNLFRLKKILTNRQNIIDILSFYG